jgi:hypothetical protein
LHALIQQVLVGPRSHTSTWLQVALGLLVPGYTLRTMEVKKIEAGEL